jgi:hypothetical protein
MKAIQQVPQMCGASTYILHRVDWITHLQGGGCTRHELHQPKSFSVRHGGWPKVRLGPGPSPVRDA